MPRARGKQEMAGELPVLRHQGVVKDEVRASLRHPVGMGGPPFPRTPNPSPIGVAYPGLDLGGPVSPAAGLPRTDALSPFGDLINLFQATRRRPRRAAAGKVYPRDPSLAHLPARRAPGTYDPEARRLAEAAVASAISRAAEGDAVDRFGEPDALSYFRRPSGTEVDFLVPTFSGAAPEWSSAFVAESKDVDAVTAKDSRAMVASSGDGLFMTRGAIDLEPQVRGVTVIPAARFAWRRHQHGKPVAKGMRIDGNRPTPPRSGQEGMAGARSGGRCLGPAPGLEEEADPDDQDDARPDEEGDLLLDEDVGAGQQGAEDEDDDDPRGDVPGVADDEVVPEAEEGRQVAHGEILL
jgi:hypothetical protein